MKVLVTGGTGFLGSHVVRRLARDDHTVTVFRRASSSTSAIHAAASAPAGGARPDSYEVNVASTRTVVQACIAAGVNRLVHVSSVAAIGVPDDRTPADEDFVFNLGGSRLYYHISKRKAEDVVREGVARGLDCVIVNPGSLWGPFRGEYRDSNILRRVRHARRVRVSPGGICIAHVDDVATGIAAAMLRGSPGTRYILGGDNLTYREWITMIASVLDVRPRLVPVPGIALELLAKTLGYMAGVRPRFHGPYLRAYFAGRYAFYDSSKAAKELEYAARPFDAILRECASSLPPEAAAA